MVSVSIIVPIYNVEEYLSECLDSLLAQVLEDYEVLMIDDGSTDSSGEIARHYAELDSRFKYYRKTNGGLGHARNYGIDIASGEYIAFLDSDDIIPPDSYWRMLSIANANDCDIVTGGVLRFDEKKESASGLHRKALFSVKTITTFYESPDLVFDSTSTNKIYKRSFFRENSLRFPEGVAYEDIPLTMRAFCRAKRIGCTRHAVYKWRIREGSITQRRTEIKNFLDRLNVLKEMERIFQEENVPEVLFFAMQKKWLDLDFKLFIDQMLEADDEYRKTAIQEIAVFLEEISKDAFRYIDAIERIKYYYISKRDLASLLEVLKYQKKGYKTLKVREKNNLFFGEFPFKGLSDSLRDMTYEVLEKKLYTRIDEVDFDERCVSIRGEISSSYLNCAKRKDISLESYLVDESGKRLFSLPVEIFSKKPYRKIRVSKTYKKILIRNLKYRYFVISVPYSELISLVNEGEYWIELEYSYKGIRFGKQRLKRPSKGLDSRPFAKKISEKGMATVDYDFLGSLYIGLSEIKSEICGIEAKSDGKVEVSCANGNHFLIDSSRKNVSFLERGLCYFKREPLFFGRDNDVLLVNRARNGSVEMDVVQPGIELISVKLDGSSLSLVLDTSLYSFSEEREVYLIGSAYQTEVSLGLFAPINDKLKILIELNNNDLTRLLRSDTYEIRIRADKRDANYDLRVYSALDRSLKANCIIQNGYKYIFDTASNECKLTVKALRPWYESTKLKRKMIELFLYPIFRKIPIKKKSVVFESSWGAKTDCNPGALYGYIQDNHPEYECIWLLNDIRIPFEGKGKAVRKGTLKYFFALARSHYFVNNANFDDNYIKRRKQIEIQTMHGTPLKTLGLDVPGELSTQEARRNFLRRCARWDYLVVQSETVRKITKSCYAYKKSYLTTGYPRNDILFRKNNDHDIADLKLKYGVNPKKDLILYAPTWRKRGHFDLMLDLNLMQQRLGEKYEIGIRVHQFAADGFDKGALSDCVHDFTYSKSMEELFLISDIVITDYSSLMFDYAILRRPLLFYVYDLEEYRDNLRGFNLDFESEAPGPLLFTTEEVVHAIENLEDTKKENAASFEKFRQKYCMYETGTASEQIFNQVFK